MQCANVTAAKQRLINKILQNSLYHIQQQIDDILSFQINETQMLQLILNYFASTNLIDGESIIQLTLFLFQKTQFRSLRTHFAVQVQNNTNRLGAILNNTLEYKGVQSSKMYKDLYQQVYQNDDSSQSKMKLNLFVIGLLESGYKTTYQKCSNIKYIDRKLPTMNKKLCSFVSQFTSQQQYKMHNQWLIKNGYVDMKTIYQSYIKFSKQLEDNEVGESSQNYCLLPKAAKYIYDEYVNDKYTCAKFRALSILQHIIHKTEEEFKQEFHIKTNQDVHTFVKLIKQSQISSTNELYMAINMSKHLEHCDIDLKFNYDFKLQDITNEIASELFSNNKLQRIQAHSNFIIVRNTTTGNLNFQEISKHSDNNKIEKFLEQFIDEQTYDILIKGGYYSNIQKIKIKYLGYIKSQKLGTIELTLDHPLELQSVYLYKVQLNNLFECENVENIYTEGFHYNEQNFNQQLHNVKRFCSLLDTFTSTNENANESGLINKLFECNNLRYVHIQEKEAGISNLVLNMNLYNLRYFYYSTNDKNQNVKLDLTNGYPEMLQILQKKAHEEPGKTQMIEIPLLGAEKLISRMRRQLI